MAVVTSSNRRDSRLLQLTSQIFLIFIFTTMLLMMYATRLQHFDEVRDAVGRTKVKFHEEMRLQKLRELQRTIFVNPRRPPDSTYNINVTLSESISLERNISDSRPVQCQKMEEYATSTLPTVTIIIPFYNEALSMLLRTVHSILIRTPDELLKQVILVDDHSPNEDLHEPLSTYVKLLPAKVELVRTEKREGLIRARLIGTSMARGDVLFFLDAHTECNVGWAEPLLEEIRKNPKTVIQPHVDQLDQWTLKYVPISGGVVPRGGFTWDLSYAWMEMPEHEKKRLNYRHTYVAHRTPTLVGCAMAIRKDYFLSIGGFDDDMNIWGGENIELAFRVWMCGGQVLNHPCSRVAHTFKPFAYQFDGDQFKIIQKNQMRLVELWMDDWKKFFFASTWSWATKQTYLTDEENKSLERRKAMKRNLKCKGFEWYMQTIVPEIPTPPLDAVYYGEVFNLESERCLYVASNGFIEMADSCYISVLLLENIFHVDGDGRFLYKHHCIAIDHSTLLLKLGVCLDTLVPYERWDMVRHSEVEGVFKATFQRPEGPKTLCLTQVTSSDPAKHAAQLAQLNDCNEEMRFQKWRWNYKFDFSYKLEKPTNVEQQVYQNLNYFLLLEKPTSFGNTK